MLKNTQVVKKNRSGKACCINRSHETTVDTTGTWPFKAKSAHGRCSATYWAQIRSNKEQLFRPNLSLYSAYLFEMCQYPSAVFTAESNAQAHGANVVNIRTS